jgi:SNF2 family DNA or RNA helicase
LNLTAADTVFLFDPWWNEAVERQAIDRAHRIGRKRTVFVKRYLTVHSIEERMCGLKSAKQQEADQILEEDTSVLGLCADEWLDLLTNS